MRTKYAIALRIGISLALHCTAFATQAGVQAQTNQLAPPLIIAISPRIFLHGAQSTTLKIMVNSPPSSEAPHILSEVLWNGTPLSATLVSGIYQAAVPADLLTVSQSVAISMRKRNALTGEVGDPSLAESATVTDTVLAPVHEPSITVFVHGVYNSLSSIIYFLHVDVRDRYDLPLNNAPILVDASFGAFNWGNNASPQPRNSFTDQNGGSEIEIYIPTGQLTQTATLTMSITASTVFVGEFASTALSDTILIPRSTTYLPVMHQQFPPNNHDFCHPHLLPQAPLAFSRQPTAPQDVYEPDFTVIPPGEPMITMPHGIQINNYSAVGRLELYSAHQYPCLTSNTPMPVLIASTPIPPSSQQPFHWCPPEARFTLTGGFFYIVVRNDANLNARNYSISANFQISSTSPTGMDFCAP